MLVRGRERHLKETLTGISIRLLSPGARSLGSHPIVDANISRSSSTIDITTIGTSKNACARS